ncbi:MAG: hypothetical protein QW201_02785 [Thermoproteota archaeon]
MRKAVLVFVLLVIAIPLAYFGMLYISATSARYSISSTSLSEIPDPLELLLSRQLDIELYLDIEGHGLLSVPVRSLNGQIYLEDTYVENVRSTEHFRIQLSEPRLLILHSIWISQVSPQRTFSISLIRSLLTTVK